MPQSTRFPVAIHILIALTLRTDRLNSEDLAWSVDTNPSMVRRILASLNRAGLVTSQAGAAGGATIAKDPRQITLLDVLQAVELKPSIGVHTPNPECPLGAILGEPLQAVLDEAEGAAEQVLAESTVYDVAQIAQRRIARRAKKPGRSRRSRDH